MPVSGRELVLIETLLRARRVTFTRPTSRGVSFGSSVGPGEPNRTCTEDKYQRPDKHKRPHRSARRR
jgi:hypothetical protein